MTTAIIIYAIIATLWAIAQTCISIRNRKIVRDWNTRYEQAVLSTAAKFLTDEYQASLAKLQGKPQE